MVRKQLQSTSASQPSARDKQTLSGVHIRPLQPKPRRLGVFLRSLAHRQRLVRVRFGMRTRAARVVQVLLGVREHQLLGLCHREGVAFARQEHHSYCAAAGARLLRSLSPTVQVDHSHAGFRQQPKAPRRLFEPHRCKFSSLL